MGQSNKEAALSQTSTKKGNGHDVKILLTCLSSNAMALFKLKIGCLDDYVMEVLFGTIDSDNFESQMHPDTTGTGGAQPTTQRVRQTAGSAQPEENSPASSQAGRNIQEIQSMNNLEAFIRKEHIPMRTPQEPSRDQPGQSFKFSFLDQNIDTQYKREQQTGKLFAVFSALAIFVSCIGLFALSAYITHLRTKEIGVRKVLGASVQRVVMLLSFDFTKMILLSFVLAVPVAWYVMENWWLQTFAYRITMDAWIFLISGLLALMISWLTVSYQSIKAAIQNPVISLRSE